MADHEDSNRPLLEIEALTIDCPDPAAIGDFYLAALGGTVTHRTEDAVFLQTNGLLLIFRRDPNYKAPTWPSPAVPLQTHFELVTENLEDAVLDLTRLGATLAAFQGHPSPNLKVMLDPAGKPFCVIRKSAAVPSSP